MTRLPISHYLLPITTCPVPDTYYPLPITKTDGDIVPDETLEPQNLILAWRSAPIFNCVDNKKKKARVVKVVDKDICMYVLSSPSTPVS